MDEIRHQPDGASKKSLHQATGFAWGTVCKCVDRLATAGVLLTERQVSHRPGGQLSLVRFNPAGQFFGGIALGGSQWRLVFTDYSFQILFETSLPSPENIGAENFSEAIQKFLSDSLSLAKLVPKKLHSIGVAVPGLVNPETGEVYSAGNLGFPAGTNLPLREQLEKLLGIPTLVVPSHAAILQSEYYFGAFAETPNLITVGFGIGIGAGIIANDSRIVSRPDHPTGHIGHIYIPGNPRICSCGRIGCLESYSGGKSLVSIAAERWPECGWRSVSEIDAAALAGDRRAIRLLNRAAKYDAFAVAMLIQMYRPDAIVFTGGQCMDGGYLYGKLREYLRKYLPKEMRDSIPAAISILGEYGGALGAARLAFEEFF